MGPSTEKDPFASVVHIFVQTFVLDVASFELFGVVNEMEADRKDSFT